MIHVYRRSRSAGARALANMLGGCYIRSPTRALSTIPLVCWGEQWRGPGTKILNGSALHNKWSDIVTLTSAGVPTVTGQLDRPVGETVYDQISWTTMIDRVSDLIMACQARNRDCLEVAFGAVKSEYETHWTGRSAREVPVNWLGRTFSHVGGGDLLAPPVRPDFYVKKESISYEYRVHSFLGKSIRAGRKVHRPSFIGTPHAWIRSFDAGWMIQYDGEGITKEMRKLAHRAMSALGLDFGAVDIARLESGQLIVLEVNRAPGLEGNTIHAYVKAIKEWANED